MVYGKRLNGKTNILYTKKLDGYKLFWIQTNPNYFSKGSRANPQLSGILDIIVVKPIQPFQGLRNLRFTFPDIFEIKILLMATLPKPTTGPLQVP